MNQLAPVFEAALLISGYKLRDELSSTTRLSDADKRSHRWDDVRSLPHLCRHIRAQIDAACPTVEWHDRFSWYLITDLLSGIDDAQVQSRQYLVVAKHMLACGGPYTDSFLVPVKTVSGQPITLRTIRAKRAKSGGKAGIYAEDMELRRLMCARILGLNSNVFRRPEGHPATAAKALLAEIKTAITTPNYIDERIERYRQTLRNEELTAATVQRSTKPENSASAAGPSTTTPIEAEPISASSSHRADLRELVEVLHDGRFPCVGDTNRYVLHTTESQYGNRGSRGTTDPYVPRTRNKFDRALASSLGKNEFTLIVGPSKSGKTRSAFHGLETVLPHSGIVVPLPGQLSALVDHPQIAQTATSLVVWLDDIDRYMGPSDPLTPSLLDKLLSRPGHTRVLGTLRSEQRAFLLGDLESVNELAAATVAGPSPSEIRGQGATGRHCLAENFASNAYQQIWRPLVEDDIRRTQQLLRAASTIDLDHTTPDPGEQRASAAAYPHEDFDHFGLGAQLACGPDLLRLYRDSEHWKQPLLHAVLRAAIDWSRCGRQDPIPESALVEAARSALGEFRRDLHTTTESLLAAIEQGRTPRPGDGKAVPLISHLLMDGRREYRAYDFLVSADDDIQRPIADRRWDDALQGADAATAYGVTVAAYHRGQPRTAVRLGKEAAKLGSTAATYLVGYLYENSIEPPELETALTWYLRGADDEYLPAQLSAARILSRNGNYTDADALYAAAATTRDVSAMHQYAGFLLSTGEPSRRSDAVELLEECAKLGDIWAICHLGCLLADSEPPNLKRALFWLNKGVDQPVIDANRAVINAMRIRLGYIAVHQMDPPRISDAKKWFDAAEADGEPAAMVGLADIAANHQKTPNNKYAEQMYLRAARSEDAYAMGACGRFLLQKWHSLDNADGLQWLERASALGDVASTFYLGQLYINHGQGDDIATGVQYVKDAAENKYIEAMEYLGGLYSENNPAVAQRRPQVKTTGWRRMVEWFTASERDVALKSAIYWYTQAADRGHINAMISLGNLYWTRFDPPALKSSREWLEKAAKAGEPNAMCSLADLLMELWQPPEVDSAISWYTAAGYFDHIEAMYCLGYILKSSSPRTAEFWYRRAAKLGDVESMKALAALLRQQFGDSAESLEWDRRAARQNGTQ